MYFGKTNCKRARYPLGRRGSKQAELAAQLAVGEVGIGNLGNAHGLLPEACI